MQDKLLDTPGVSQVREGLIELGVEEFLPSILLQLGLGGIKKALPFLKTRRAYVAQKEAARGLVDQIAGLTGKSPGFVLRRALEHGSGTIALRTLAHDIATSCGLDSRMPERQWFLGRFQRELPASAERTIIEQVLSPFEDLARWFRNTGDVFGDAAIDQGRMASDAAIRALDACINRAAA